MRFTFFAYLFILFAWSRALYRFRDGSISLRELFLWTAIWLAAGVVIGWPGLTGIIARQLGIGRGVDVVIYASIIMIFYLLFRLYIKISSVEREMTRLIRAAALKEVKSK